MKKYNFKFSKTTKIFIYLGLALAAAAFAVNTYFLATDGLGNAANVVYPILRYTLMYFVSVLLTVTLISLLLASYYTIDGTTLKTSFGIVKSKYDVAKIETVLLDRNTEKLTVYFDGGEYIVIAVNTDWYESFVDDLIKANPKISYTVKSKDVDENSPKNS